MEDADGSCTLACLNLVCAGSARFQLFLQLVDLLLLALLCSPEFIILGLESSVLCLDVSILCVESSALCLDGANGTQVRLRASLELADAQAQLIVRLRARRRTCRHCML
jgi:hypothetical protein